jgi:hypothetical protein
VTVSFLNRKEVLFMVQSTDSPAGTSFRWKQLYGSAITKLDPAELTHRIAEARGAILDRAEEILTCPACDEHRALNDALRRLRLLEEAAESGKIAA